MDLRYPAPEDGFGVHLRGHVGEEEHLAVARTRDQREFLPLMHHLKTRVAHSLLSAHCFEVFFPALPVGRIGEHEIKFLRRKCVVVCKGRPFCAADNVLGAFCLTFEQHVCLADGVGLGIDFLAIQETGNLQLPLFSDYTECLLTDREHTAGAARAVIEQISPRFELILNG